MVLHLSMQTAVNIKYTIFGVVVVIMIITVCLPQFHLDKSYITMRAQINWSF